MYKKNNGVYYTPALLAEYLAEPLIENNSTSILDPAYGEGALLLAAEKILKKKNSFGITNKLFGCDITPVNGLLKHLPEANLQQIDFFDFKYERLFQTILMNPPYVRHQIQDEKNIDRYRKEFPELKIVNKSADLWAYFLIKAISHLDKNGNVGAILPWAFLQADYSKSIRKWLLGIFKEIKVLTLSDKFFEEAEERVVLLWLKGYGKKCKSLKIATSKGIDSNVKYFKLSEDIWNADRVFNLGKLGVLDLFNKFKVEYGFNEFHNYADVKIGVVSGAVDYFIISQSEQNKFDKSRLVPILMNSNEFSKYLKSGKRILNLLVALKDKDHLKYRAFIKRGIEGEYNLRSHSKARKPWYAVKLGKLPDAFFHYRTTKIPFLLFNKDKSQSTNAIHRVYFKNSNLIEQKWMFVSLLSVVGQLSLEVNSKSYGRGILKIEPKSLKNALVIKRDDIIVESVYEQLVNLLIDNNKEQAMNLATEFINEQLNIPLEFSAIAAKYLKSLQTSRINI